MIQLRGGCLEARQAASERGVPGGKTASWGDCLEARKAASKQWVCLEARQAASEWGGSWRQGKRPWSGTSASRQSKRPRSGGCLGVDRMGRPRGKQPWGRGLP
ncbi:hypothetical protein H5410_051734 [Solanum commersonii]|uniref:Uncharacterized protein n=1 Tax=Solanum commersonii TaxID=4109 RepID=A0A9J5WZ92_SOLCO|nr:hypothetical protein H5410_051734 [Solanum commersonii]